jgi:hypothetical protein
VTALTLLVAAKVMTLYPALTQVLNVQVPFYFKDIIDKLNIDLSQLDTTGSLQTAVMAVVGSAILGCTPPYNR